MIYVSAQHGNDGNPGTFEGPYREISKAIAQSSTGETVVVFDSGEYGTFTVDKGVTIVADGGVLAEVDAPAADFGNAAVTINGGATDVVVLRGLTIKGTGGTAGIVFRSGKTLRLEQCTISNFVSTSEGIPGYGIQVFQGLLTVKDTVLRDNSNGMIFSAATRGIVDNCQVEGDETGIGMEIGADAHVTVTGSLLSGHDMGIYLRGADGSPIPLLTLNDTVITHNRIGLYADRSGQVHLTRSTVSLNSTGLFTLNNGVIYTTGTNSVIGNLVDNDSGANIVFFSSDVTG